MLISDTLKYRIALSLARGIKAADMRKIIEKLADPEIFFKSTDQSLRTSFGVPDSLLQQRQALLHRAEAEIHFMEEHGICARWFQEDDFPQLLNQCEDAPLLLFTNREHDLNKGKMISVVGARHATERGRKLTEDLIHDLAGQLDDLTVISGLAYGIDITAHRAAVEANVPTFAVLAHGLDRIYPSSHRPLALKMSEKGGLLTEFPSLTEPFKMNFVQRNRIIAGLSPAVIVIESASKGGSLLTAEMAFDYYRNLFAFPGRPSDPYSVGCNCLIRDQKAALINSAEDLISAMQWERKDTSISQGLLFPSLSEQAQGILDLFAPGVDALHMDHLLRISGLKYGELNNIILELILEGVLKSLPGNTYVKA